MQREYKYIRFEPFVVKDQKYVTYICAAIRPNNRIGRVIWNDYIKTYMFRPNGEGCLHGHSLLDIAHFIKQLMDERKT